MEREDAMKQPVLCAIIAGTIFMPILAIVQAQDKQNHAPAVKPAPSKEDDGQNVFEQNCSRCHNAPEGFSPRISATIVRHMRVRANLSREDEQKLLRFFIP
jgi:cytochrome c5